MSECNHVYPGCVCAQSDLAEARDASFRAGAEWMREQAAGVIRASRLSTMYRKRRAIYERMEQQILRLSESPSRKPCGCPEKYVCPRCIPTSPPAPEEDKP